MKIVVSKKQYKNVAYKLLKTILGELRYETMYENDEKTIQSLYIYRKNDSSDDVSSPMTIWFPTTANIGCKRDLTLDGEFSQMLERFIPLFRTKLFSKVLVQYVYDELGIKCDCVQYDYDFTHDPDLSNDEYAFYTSKTSKYNVKKKKKIDESFLIESKLKNLIIDRLGVDLTGMIERVNDSYDLPMEFDNLITPGTLKVYINTYGPLYLIKTNKKTLLYQNQDGYKAIADYMDRTYSESEVIELLGLPPIGLSIDDIISAFT